MNPRRSRAVQDRRPRDSRPKLDDLPLQWQLIARGALARRQWLLTQLSGELNQLRSTVDSRRADIREFLDQDEPIDAYATAGEYSDRPRRRSRYHASPTNVDGGADESLTRDRMLEEIVQDLISGSSGRKPTLTNVNRALTATKSRKASQAELDRAVERIENS